MTDRDDTRGRTVPHRDTELPEGEAAVPAGSLRGGAARDVEPDARELGDGLADADPSVQRRPGDFGGNPAAGVSGGSGTLTDLDIPEPVRQRDVEENAGIENRRDRRID